MDRTTGKPSEDTLAKVVGVLSRPYSDANHYKEREELLRLTTSLLSRGSNDTAYLLVWLLDSGSCGDELRLDQVFACEAGEDCRTPDDLTLLSGAKVPLELPGKDSLPAATIEAAIGIAQPNNVLSHWLAARGLASSQLDEVLEPLVTQKGKEGATSRCDIGALQVLVHRVTTYQHDGPPELNTPRIMAQALAGRIVSSRRHRIWTAQATLNSQVSKPKSPPRKGGSAPADTIDTILTIAAKTVGLNLRARFVTIDYIGSSACTHANEGIYEKPHDGAPCMDPAVCDLLSNQLARQRQAFSVANMYDPDEMQTAIDGDYELPKGWPPADEPTAWMGVPVMTEAIRCSGSAGETVKAESPICTIQAFSKTSPGFVYNAFSRTDFKLVNTIADALANILPEHELRFALQTISTRLSDCEKEDEFDVTLVFDLIRELLPCSTYAAIVKETGLSSATRDCNNSLLKLNEKRIFAITEGGILPMGHPNHEQFHHVFVRNIYRVGGHHGHLVIGLAGNEMPVYRRNIVRYLCQGVSAYMSDEFRHQQNLHKIIEVRHAVRSGLTGAIGHLSLANARFALFKDKPETMAYRRLIASPGLRRSLQRANFYAEKTRILLEQSRYLLAELSGDTLKITHFGIRDLINEVVSCIRPEVEDKDCTIDVDFKIGNDYPLGWADRDLYYVLLFNVFENAVKYSFRKQPIRITARASVDTWLVEVANTGLPIPKEREKAIFEPFTRGAPMTHPDARRPGTGLGLTVAKRIIEAHDPKLRIRLHSHPKTRQAALTTFILPLPRRTRPNKPDSQEA